MSSYVPDGSAWVSDAEWQRRKGAGRAADRRASADAARYLAGERKALSVRRPWANLIFAGKTVENRTWYTSYRGELCIHAGQAFESTGAALAAELGLSGFETKQQCAQGYLGMVRLADVHPAAGCCSPWGEPGPEVYHWVLTTPRPFAAAVPGRGRLGLYWAPAEALPEASS